jgi:1-acyl-sn-glycerol-3-phosphate acyltransferase
MGLRRLPKLRRPGYGEPMTPAWRMVWMVLYGPVAASTRTQYLHIERVPQQGPAILVANHVSHYDPFLLAKFVIDAARIPRFLAKDSIFDVFAVGPAMRAMGQIPVRRGTADARQSLDAAVQALRAGKVIVMHPEGTVTRDPLGWPMAGKTGVARIAHLVPEVPVIPLAQWGVQDSIDLYNKKVKLVPRPRHVISVGEPVDLSDLRGKEPSAGVLRAMTDVIMRRLRDDVAELRGIPAPADDLFVWRRPGEQSTRPQPGRQSGRQSGDAA